MSKRLRELMTRDVETAGADDSLRECAEKMRALNVGSLPVCEADKPVGIVTDRDIVVRAIAMGQDPATSRVRDVMTEGVRTLKEDASIDDAADLMKREQIRRVLVVDGAGKLCGILALGDLSQEASDRKSGETLEAVSEPSAPSM